MTKEVIIEVDSNGNYKIPKLIRLRDNKNKKYKVLYEGKYYEKEKLDKNIREITQLAEALNIKDKKQRLSYIYNKACDLLDSDFYGKNICNFKNNKCLHDRKDENKYDGCCQSNNGKHCKYLKNHKCEVRCLACKFHICKELIKLGYKYRVNDILVLKYLLNFKQKIIVYLDYFMSEEEVLEDIYKNSIILWVLKKEKDKFIKDKE